MIRSFYKFILLLLFLIPISLYPASEVGYKIQIDNFTIAAWYTDIVKYDTKSTTLFEDPNELLFLFLNYVSYNYESIKKINLYFRFELLKDNTGNEEIFFFMVRKVKKQRSNTLMQLYLSKLL